MSRQDEWWRVRARPRQWSLLLLALGAQLTLGAPGGRQALAAPSSMTPDSDPAEVAESRETRAQEITAAEALYQEARNLMDDGEYEKACPLLEESNRHDFALGTLLYLAQCYEEVGRTAAAWSAFELAASESRKSNQERRARIARQRADALKPKLMRLKISVPQEHRVEGLVITRNGAEVREPVYDVAIPVDPGAQHIEATAPKHEPWSTEVELTEPGKTVTVLIPHLVPAPQREAAPDGAGEVEPILEPPPTLGDHPRATNTVPWSTVGLAIAGAGVLGAGMGTYLVLHARSLEDDGKKHCEKQEVLACNDDGMALLDDADRELLWGQIALGAGSAAILGGLGLYLWAPEPRAESAQRFIPAVGTRSAALLWRGTF